MKTTYILGIKTYAAYLNRYACISVFLSLCLYMNTNKLNVYAEMERKTAAIYEELSVTFRTHQEFLFQ